MCRFMLGLLGKDEKYCFLRVYLKLFECAWHICVLYYALELLCQTPIRSSVFKWRSSFNVSSTLGTGLTHVRETGCMNTMPEQKELLHWWESVPRGQNSCIYPRSCVLLNRLLFRNMFFPAISPLFLQNFFCKIKR